jgi:hypothetical protein
MKRKRLGFYFLATLAFCGVMGVSIEGSKNTIELFLWFILFLVILLAGILQAILSD